MDALAAGHDAAVQMIDIENFAANCLVFVKLAANRIWLRASRPHRGHRCPATDAVSRSDVKRSKYPDISVSTRS
jgi:hypothetical protein